ncbi:hypothetical protein FACS1894151_10260 [Spirochaetia bacterium]|nr:hypothetical protein FACS1894151_10260 [Spirochaetia bacterium]
MNEQEIRAKAPEIAVLILGPPQVGGLVCGKVKPKFPSNLLIYKADTEYGGIL